MRATMRPHEVFLSHASQDGKIAERIAQVLRDHGLPTFFSPTNVIGAQQWQNEILQALKRCDWFIVLLSPNAINSMWVKRETAFALKERRYENQIVPLLYRDCDLGPLEWLTILQIVDFRGKFDDDCRALLRVWGLGFKG
jgi:hypothetical protein